MLLPPPRLSRRLSRLLNEFFKICWLVPSDVGEDERIIRAIYSPYHIDKHNKLKHQAYDPTPRTDEISTMRLEHMGAPFCRLRAKSMENPDKVLRGLAVLNVSAIVSNGMQVVDSRQQYCGHADIKLLIAEVANRRHGEPLPPIVGKKFKDLKEQLLKCSTLYIDPNTSDRNQDISRYLERVENHC